MACIQMPMAAEEPEGKDAKGGVGVESPTRSLRNDTWDFYGDSPRNGATGVNCNSVCTAKSFVGGVSWATHLQSLPTDPWDFYTDAPRDGGGKQFIEKTVVPVETSEGKSVDDLDLVVAFCVALGASDHTRPAVWVLDSTLSKGAPVPFKVSLAVEEGGASLLDVREEVQSSRQRLLMAQAADPSPEATLEKAAPRGRFASRGAHHICQAAFAREGGEDIVAKGPQPDFTMTAAAGGGQPVLHYRGDLYDRSTAEFLAHHVASLLNVRPTWDSLLLAKATSAMLDAEERKTVLTRWNNTTVPFAEHLLIHQLFERCARGKFGDCPAVLPFSPTDLPWTYKDVDDAAAQVADALKQLHASNPGGRVPLLVRRGPALVVSIYGVLRAGQAYVPLDPEWPPDRQGVVIEDVEPDALIIGERVEPPEVCTSGKIAYVRVAACDDGPPCLGCSIVESVHKIKTLRPPQIMRQLDTTCPAYILYTSGTTGRPKGVDVPHYGLVGRTEWLQQTWRLDRSCVVPQKTPATFAISEWEFFWPLCYGAQLALAKDGMHGDAQHIRELCSSRNVTHGVWVPSLLDALLEDLEGGSGLPDLRLILACGEALRPATIEATRAALPKTELVNLYGPTEGSMTMWRCPHMPSARDLLRFPIGVPISNTSILCVVDDSPSMPPSPVLSKGEILFGGSLIATGYWKLPQLTAEKFLPNPHGKGRVYRSGDLGRWRADGSLEFLGRIDQQVKFNGVRIELGEIESTLASLPGVACSAAFVAMPHLVAACSMQFGFTTSPEEHRRLLDGLKERLPKYYMPTRLELLESWPTTDRGKTDRKKLVEGFHERLNSAAAAGPGRATEAAAAPASETERTVLKMMQEILGVSVPLPANMVFQELGFSSLMLGKLTTRIRKTFQLPDMPATAVFQHPTASKLAAELDTMLGEDSRSTGNCVLALQELLWRGGSSTSPLSLACTLVGLLSRIIIIEYAFLPTYFMGFFIYMHYPLWVVFVAIAPLLGINMFITLLTSLLVKWLVIGQRKPGNYPIFGWYYWKWWFVRSIEEWVEAHLGSFMSNTAVYSLFLRARGGKIDVTARLNKVKISDVDLITVGRYARIERDTTLKCSRMWRGELQLQPVYIGVGAHLMQRSYVPAGTEVGALAELAPMASSDPAGPYQVVPRHDQPARNSNLLTAMQVLFGIPGLVLVEALAHIPVILAMVSVWRLLSPGSFRDVTTPAPAAAASTPHKVQAILVALAQRFAAQDGAGGSLSQGPPEDHKQGDNGWGLGDDWDDDHPFAFYFFILTLPWIFHFILGISYYLICVITKWTIIGRFRAGPVKGTWDVFRRWFFEHMITAHAYNQFMTLWVNTEVLAVLYRMLGAKIAPRVNMDCFGAVEYDLITIEREVIFGSNVLLVTTSHGESKPITILQGACVLDRCCVMPETRIPEGSLLGSFTILPEKKAIETMTVYTGCLKGEPVRLFRRNLGPGEEIKGERVIYNPNNVGIAAAPLTPAAETQRRLEQQALKRHRSDFWFAVFNLWCVLTAILFAPLTDVVYWCTMVADILIYDYCLNSHMAEVICILLIPPLYVGASLVQLFLIWTLKWVLMGRWTAGDRPYYTWFHFRWVALMNAFYSVREISATIAGTWLAVGLIRSMGGRAGKRVCFFGHPFEFDLLHMGDDVCIGEHCDVTAHTVENMVMRLEVVEFQTGANCLGGSVVMPGGQMEAHSSLVEHSQVLKGEVVPTCSVYGGLPAKLVRDYSPGTSPDINHQRGQAQELLRRADGMEMALLPSMDVHRPGDVRRLPV